VARFVQRAKWKPAKMMGAGQLVFGNPMATASYASESDLLAACRRRDLRAFEQLYHGHGMRLKSVAYHILGNRQDAEDAVQETFLKFYRAIAGFEGHSSVGTWLCRIVINVCYDMARKRHREGSGREEAVEELPATSDHFTLRVTLEDALRRIHLRQRMVFLLFEVEGLRHSEIASILEIPEGTSKAWLFEAKKELKRLLKEVRR
jgi:RNA polymerase sigma-70 factor (ECF subfamily)